MRLGLISAGISLVVGVLMGIIQTAFKDKIGLLSTTSTDFPAFFASCAKIAPYKPEPTTK